MPLLTEQIREVRDLCRPRPPQPRTPRQHQHDWRKAGHFGHVGKIECACGEGLLLPVSDVGYWGAKEMTG